MPKKTRTQTQGPPGDPHENDLKDLNADEGVESEDDIEAIDPSLLGKAVVFGTDWTAATLIDQIKKSNIDLSPIFQRRDAWKPKRKSRFIESVILGLPIPQLVLAEHPDTKGSFLVIDGKQRLLSLQQFAGINLAEGSSALKLEGLKLRHELNDKTYEDLKSDSRLIKHLNAFENQPIRTVVVKNWQKEELLYVIFYRLNSESQPLSAQELRQALHPGDFLRFAAEYSETSSGLRRTLGLDKPDFRMRDVELLVRYYAFQYRLSEYRGNLKKFLDDTCRILNAEWKTREVEIRHQATELEAAVETTFAIFGDDAFRKWEGDKFESQFNRAIFDVMAYFFSRGAVRKKAVKARGRIKAALQRLCKRDQAFLRSIETTTKSRTATSTRFTKWQHALEAELKIRIVAPIPATRSSD